MCQKDSTHTRISFWSQLNAPYRTLACRQRVSFTSHCRCSTLRHSQKSAQRSRNSKRNLIYPLVDTSPLDIHTGGQALTYRPLILLGAPVCTPLGLLTRNVELEHPIFQDRKAIKLCSFLVPCSVKSVWDDHFVRRSVWGGGVGLGTLHSHLKLVFGLPFRKEDLFYSRPTLITWNPERNAYLGSYLFKFHKSKHGFSLRIYSEIKRQQSNDKSKNKFNFAIRYFQKQNDLFSFVTYVPGPQVLAYRPQILQGVQIGTES